jgi:hypothetical protein
MEKETRRGAVKVRKRAKTEEKTREIKRTGRKEAETGKKN